jgi:anti-sigma-K factor RskA
MNEHIEQELFPFYALDALTEAERAQVELYITADPEASKRLEALMDTTKRLPQEIEPIIPSPEVKANLMARVQADARAQQIASSAPLPLRPSAPHPSFWQRLRAWYGRLQISPIMPALVGVCALIAIFAAGWAIAQMQQNRALQTEITSLTGEVATLQESVAEFKNGTAVIHAENESLQAEVTALQSENATLRQQIESQNGMLAAYQQPGSLTMAIGDATGSHPEANGTLTVDPATGTAVFVTNNLPPLDQTQVYQLWFIQGETPVSAGIFQVDESGHGKLAIATAVPGSFDAMGLTIEPAGGSETPDLDQLILLGSVS